MGTKFITFDTSWLERTGYDFSSAVFRCIQYTDYQTIISSIVDREIKKHLLVKSEEFVNKFNDSLNKAKFLLNAMVLPDPLNIDKIKANALLSYNNFKNTIRAQVIDEDKCDLKSIINDYFDGVGVFTNKNKKKEFPDAIAVNSIANFIGDNEIIIFTCDNDWKNFFSTYKNVTLYENKSDLLKIIKTDDLAGEVIDIYLDKIIGEFTDHLNNNFERYFSLSETLFPGDYCVECLDVDGFDLDFIKYTAIEVISKLTKENTFMIAVHFNYSFSVKISYDDTSSSSYDREDGKIYNVIRKHQKISGKENGYCFAEVTFEDENCEKITDFKLEDVDFCYKDSNSYKIEDDPIKEDDYYDRTW